MSRDIELEKKIDAYIKGQLTEKQAQKLWEELLKNPDYIELLNTELGVKAILSNPDITGESPGRAEDHQAIKYSAYQSWKWLSAAAAVIILAVIVSLFRMDSKKNLGELALSEISLPENLVSAPTVRSDQQRITAGDSLLNLGFKAAISGDFSEAVELYNTIIMEYPEQPVAVQSYLNRGIIQFNRNHLAEAIASFKEVVDNAGETSIIREKGYWYLGNAYIKADSLNEAYDAILKTYAMEGVFQKPAGDILRNMDKVMDNPVRENH